ncbi:polysaccharide biosynthesis/export family protein [Nevskia soli]|uniref:polysaccharide biosynthesis/export family protein n=1 Tax=Nevskia soli TaxID=418856 RepID=UPI0004A75080|nr:polysaccharide biosynthesis/export family protein [Nevskia soli]
MNSTTSAIRTISYHARRFALQWLALGCSLGLAACSSLPNSGPRTSQIHDEYQPQASSHPFELVEVTDSTIQVLKHRPAPTLAAQFGDDANTPDLVIGRGDGLTITIWEVGSDTLFSSSPTAVAPMATVNSARGSVIPEQIVGSDGCITIPFAGRIPVANHTTTDVQRIIEQALGGKAQKPQVLVNLTHNSSNLVTVVGEVTNGARVPLSPYGERLLDVLATAGGIKVPTFETRVQLTRRDSSVTVPLLQVLRDPGENVHLHPGDDLVITRQPESFTAFGATGHNALISFDAARITLTEAVAKAGGLTDSRADPRGVFLFRFEPKSIAENLGTAPSEINDDAPVPVVYQLDLSKAGSYFLAQNFDVRDHDILYISNSPSTELEKFLNLVGLVVQPLINGAIVDSSVK